MPATAPSRKPTRAERTRRLRRLAVTWTVVAFAGLWGVIYAQMRTGSDPVLGAGTATAITAGTSGAAATDTSTAGDAGASTTTDDTASFAESTGTDTSAMTTAQS